MKPRCLTSTRFTMKADLLTPGQVTDDPVDPTDYGEWVNSQDPLTGEIVRKWVPFPNDPNTEDDESVKFGSVDCLVRGIVDGGIRVAGTTERFGDTYQNLEYIKMWVPVGSAITKNTRITNIREAKTGRVIWLDEEFAGVPRATVFNVNGVTPLLDAFNRHVEDFILLERAEVS